MQEIIPAIEEAWRRSAGKNHHVRVVDVGRETIASYMADLALADQIVFTCFTSKLVRLGEFLRRDAGVRGRYVVYLHNQATIGCWPFYAWGMGEHFRTDDVFVSSSTRDARTFRLTFPKGDVRVHPFSLPLPVDRMKSPGRNGFTTFVYAGRLSSQKNLHTLLVAFALVAEARPDARLIIYGGEDGLGSPNMGFKDVGYSKFLVETAEALGIEGRVTFAGSLDREVLHRRLRDPHVLVSASLHSDENFGMSALRSLCMGAPAVLSSWGGHADFAKEFPGRVELVAVRGSKRGPWIDPRELAREMSKALVKKASSRSGLVPAKYRMKAAADLVRRLALEPEKKTKAKLEPSRLAKSVLSGREGEQKVFASYGDRRAHAFLKGYGMGPVRRRPAKKLRLLPWIFVSGDEIVARDPHRGIVSWRLEKSEAGVGIESFDGRRAILVPRPVARDLAESGFVLA